MSAKFDMDAAVERLKINLKPSFEPAARAGADALRRAIAAQPGDKWDRTGHLASGLRASGDSVTHPSDRLQRDELKQRFFDEVVPDDPTDDAAVAKAIEQVLSEVIR